MKYLTLILIIISTFSSFGALCEVSFEDFPYSVGGKRWSKNRGKFTNGCLDKNGEISERACFTLERDSHNEPVVTVDTDYWGFPGSKAAQECRSIGGRLPTRFDYFELIKSFEEETEWTYGYVGPELKEAGLISLSKVFGGEQLDSAFWTASIYQPYQNVPSANAYVFARRKTNAFLYYGGTRYETASVRCISDE